MLKSDCQLSLPPVLWLFKCLQLPPRSTETKGTKILKALELGSLKLPNSDQEWVILEYHQQPPKWSLSEHRGWWLVISSFLRETGEIKSWPLRLHGESYWKQQEVTYDMCMKLKKIHAKHWKKEKNAHSHYQEFNEILILTITHIFKTSAIIVFAKQCVHSSLEWHSLWGRQE